MADLQVSLIERNQRRHRCLSSLRPCDVRSGGSAEQDAPCSPGGATGTGGGGGGGGGGTGEDWSDAHTARRGKRSEEREVGGGSEAEGVEQERGGTPPRTPLPS